MKIISVISSILLNIIFDRMKESMCVGLNTNSVSVITENMSHLHCTHTCLCMCMCVYVCIIPPHSLDKGGNLPL